MKLIDYIKRTNNDLQECSSNEYQESNVSEFVINKILYIQYGCFYNRFKKELFKPKFVAWKYGPVEINYRKSIESNKEFDFEVNLNSKEQKFLDNLTKRLLKASPWFLVNFSHNTSAWADNYKENESNNISNNEIQSSFDGVSII